MRHQFYVKFQTKVQLQSPAARPKAWRRRLYLVWAVCLSLSSSLPVSPALAAHSCDDVQFIFARGSGESLDDVSATDWQTSITSTLRDSTLRYHFYELGDQTQGGYRYPAVSVSGSFAGFGHLLGAYIGKGQSFDFGASVDQGIGELRSYIHTVNATCPQTKFVLGGYSQGAMIMSYSIGFIAPERIIYTATFGDPKLYLPEGKGVLPPACFGRSLSDYRAYVPDCHAYEGILGSYRPYQPDGYANKVGTWCNTKDIMCSSGSSISDHTEYTSSGLYANAAREIKSRLKQTFPRAFPLMSAKDWANVAHNVAFVFDTTVSMKNYINAYQKEAMDFVAQVVQNGGRAAVAEYRDLDDPYPPRILCNFSCQQSEINTKLKYLISAGGGDDQESALSALLYAMNHLDWQTGVAKSIILVTDNAYHSPDRDGTTLQQVIQRSLEIDPVNVYVLTRQEYQSSYASLVAQTGGASFDITKASERAKLQNTVLYRPLALLNSSAFSGAIGDEFYFDASGSRASDGGTLRYDWDLNGDGEFEILNAPAQLTQSYDSNFSGYIQVKVTDAQGRSSTMSASLTVTESLAPVPEMPKIFNVNVEKLDTTTFRVSYQTNAERVLVALDDTPTGYLDATRREVTVTEVSDTLTLHLVPYHSHVGRGEGTTLTLHGRTKPQPEPTPGPDSNSDSNTDSSAGSSTGSSSTSTPINPVSPPPASRRPSPSSIPKAPNSGVVPQNSTTTDCSNANDRRTRIYKR